MILRLRSAHWRHRHPLRSVRSVYDRMRTKRLAPLTHLRTGLVSSRGNLRGLAHNKCSLGTGHCPPLCEMTAQDLPSVRWETGPGPCANVEKNRTLERSPISSSWAPAVLGAGCHRQVTSCPLGAGVKSTDQHLCPWTWGPEVQAAVLRSTARDPCPLGSGCRPGTGSFGATTGPIAPRLKQKP